jgi:23S rRNA C2498 (ribose-2'-O)-methylase RlmM
MSNLPAALLQAQLDELRDEVRRATQAVIEIELQRLPVEDRIKVLTGAWDKAVKPALMLQAETNAALRQLRAFDVPFPNTLRRRLIEVEDLDPKA